MTRVGVPSKGRLMQDCVDWFGARGVVMRRAGSDREYSGVIEGIAGAVPVQKVDDRTLGSGKPGPITRVLNERFHALVRA